MGTNGARRLPETLLRVSRVGADERPGLDKGRVARDRCRSQCGSGSADMAVLGVISPLIHAEMVLGFFLRAAGGSRGKAAKLRFSSAAKPPSMKLPPSSAA